MPMRRLDVVILRGTNHSWVNSGSEPTVLAAILIHATTTARLIRVVTFGSANHQAGPDVEP